MEDVKQRKLVLNGAANSRDLGGFTNINNAITRKGVFFRSDSLHNLSEEDISALKKLGVTMQIDLRTEQEVISNPSRLLHVEGISYYNVNFLDNIHSSNFKDIPKSMAEMYCSLLDDYSEKYAIVFRAILSNKGSCIFNCTAGKDRTGVLSMLLLKLAGVSEDDIVQDYSISGENMAIIFDSQRQKLKKVGYNLPEYIFSSAPIQMSLTLDYLREKYIDARGYLSFCGLTDEEIDALRNRLIG